MTEANHMPHPDRETLIASLREGKAELAAQRNAVRATENRLREICNRLATADGLTVRCVDVMPYDPPTRKADPLVTNQWEATLDAADKPETAEEQAAVVIRIVLEWLLAKPSRLAVADRCIALAWVVNPALFDGQGIKEVASQYDCHPVRLWATAAEASRRFGIRNRAQRLNVFHAEAAA